MASENDYTTLHPISVAARDYAGQQSRPSTEDLFRRAAEQSGRPLARMLREANQGAKWPGRMTQHEYVSLRLYDLEKDDRKSFISDWLHWAIHDECKDEEWSEKTVDKWECSQVLGRAGIPTIPVIAVIDGSGTSYGDTPTITSASELAELLATATLPLFAKPNRLLGSFGALRIESLDQDMIVANGGAETFELSTMLNQTLSDLPYVVQPVIENHADIRRYAEGLATLRTVNFVKNGAVRLDRAVFKIPVAGNYADNNWRPGNLLGDIHPETGVIQRVTRGSGPDVEEFTHHPETDTPLVGTTLPGWQSVRDLNERTAQLFGAINYQSLDIALTDTGPLVVEVNSGGSFSLPQLASSRGLLTNENKDFFESCGVNFRKLAKRA